MPTAKNLTKRQCAVIEDLFAGLADEREVLAKHKIDRRLYDKWLTDENFTREFDRRLESARRQSDLIIARYATLAASKLALLTESENQETSRKACLDIIGLLKGPPEIHRPSDESPATSDELPPEIASRLLAALAAGNSPREIKNANPL
jgi:hypothetical protein